MPKKDTKTKIIYYPKGGFALNLDNPDNIAAIKATMQEWLDATKEK